MDVQKVFNVRDSSDGPRFVEISNVFVVLFVVFLPYHFEVALHTKKRYLEVLTRRMKEVAMLIKGARRYMKCVEAR